jgi:hypothetical protein
MSNEDVVLYVLAQTQDNSCTSVHITTLNNATRKKLELIRSCCNSKAIGRYLYSLKAYDYRHSVLIKA